MWPLMTDNPKTYAANDLRNSKAEAFLAAYSGEPVTIRHNRFPGGHFDLRFVKPEINLTDEQKNALILEMTLFSHGANNGLTFELIEGSPGYVVISGPPDIATGKQFYRWFNYQQRNGFADSLEECLQKAREHAKCQSK